MKLEGHVSLSIKQKILRDGKEGCARETQEGETGDAPPVAEKASPFRGRLPAFGRKAHGNRLGQRCIPAPCGEKKLFRHAEMAFRQCWKAM